MTTATDDSTGAGTDSGAGTDTKTGADTGQDSGKRKREPEPDVTPGRSLVVKLDKELNAKVVAIIKQNADRRRNDLKRFDVANTLERAKTLDDPAKEESRLSRRCTMPAWSRCARSGRSTRRSRDRS